MKGKLHILVMFSLGGVLARVALLPTMIMLLWVIWKGKYQKHHFYLLTLSLLLGLALYIKHPLQSPPPLTLHSDLLTVQVVEHPEHRDSYVRFVAKDGDNHRLFFYAFDSVPDSLVYGATCTVEGEFEETEPLRNEGGFNYGQYLQSRSASGTFLVKNVVDCEGRANLTALYQWRDDWMSRIKQTYLPNHSAWILALVFGDKSELEQGVIETYQRWNLSHLLAISGLHIGLFMSTLYVVLVRLGIVTKERALLAIMVMLPVYGVLAGGAPSVWRAIGMAELYFILSLFRIRIPMSDLLSGIVLVVLFTNANYLLNLGFQFSFWVTFFLLLSRKLMTTSFMQGLLTISLISQLSLLPLQLYAFYSFNPLSLVANLLFVPFITLLLLPVCFVASIGFLVPALSFVFDSTFRILLKISDVVLTTLDERLYVEWVVGRLSVLESLMYIFLLILFLFHWSKGEKMKGFLYGIGTVIVLAVHSFIPYVSPHGYVTMVDVGQGDTFVIELPYRKHVLVVDAAGAVFPAEHDVYQEVLEPFLHERGIKTIDTLLLTHKDMDHVGSAEPMIKGFRPSTVVVSPYFEQDESLSQSLQESGARLKFVKGGDVVRLQTLDLSILSPMVQEEDKNENSIVFLMKLGGLKWLFTGDSGVEVEERMLNALPTLDIDVLKVGHHGSSSSTSPLLLERTTPSIAWISAGKDNRYGHPHADVVQNLDAEGVEVMRTDLHGAVTYKFTDWTGTFYKTLP
ncbi:hypothetical protein N781_11070 [Pontibacillus halophilus JSM 076056 = DSM 19796]|uniref:Metallo-beta-lactamase domain-containing protein n=1 Tax=Pontibacillus halophilus JSM 076056 = DSM 19796 TaxID=1385510 RepID=A0A0A5GQX3_9BACI|nr:DNA internalization-related competence protein ComEC/Rec2 [Pontibacillus halophilus]KGX93638.1 hypothetical protein N781_11070 [Pontibacillus halophilus JSM 076056 = DSM 19796]